MNQAEQASKAEAFRALHRGARLLLMANAWDAITARLFEAEGFAAVATTSGGVSWALGYADGEAAPWDEDRSPAPDIERLAVLLRNGAVADAASAVCGDLA